MSSMPQASNSVSPVARLQFAPDRMGPLGERHIGIAFAHRAARDPRLAMARPHGVRRREAVDADRGNAAPRELVERRRAHRAEPDDGDIRPPRIMRRPGIPGAR